MAPIKALSVAAASLLLVGIAEAAQAYTVTLGNEGACLTQINAAREAAGLTRFTQPGSEETTKRLPASTEIAVWNPVCTALLPAQPAERVDTTGKFQGGTYAYLALDSKSPDCSAAVQAWQKAFTNFDGLPPKKADSKSLYDKQVNVSFVALYNPASNAAADCRVVTCSTQAPPGRSTEPEGASALICMTTPDAFASGNAPFTQKEWDNIASALTSSASASVPTLLALATVATGLALL